MFQTETALVYDAVLLFATALDALPPQLNDVRMTPLSCNQDRASKHGADLVNFIKTVYD